jgi:transposase-like protein
MKTSVLDEKHFHDEEAAYAYLEARVWPNGPICPKCGGFERIGKMGGKSTRIGVHKCYQCRKPFRVTVGTVFEASHVPLRLWLQAVHLMASSKKGISSNQLHRTLGVTLKTAWFMSHRIREAMRVLGVEPMGGAGAVIEADEIYIGRVKGVPFPKGGNHHKNMVLTLVERDGEARSFHMDGQSISDFMKIIRANVPTCRAKAASIPMNTSTTTMWARNLRATIPCTMPAKNMPGNPMNRVTSSPPTPLKVSIRFSNEV